MSVLLSTHHVKKHTHNVCLSESFDNRTCLIPQCFGVWWQLPNLQPLIFRGRIFEKLRIHQRLCGSSPILARQRKLLHVRIFLGAFHQLKHLLILCSHCLVPCGVLGAKKENIIDTDIPYQPKHSKTTQKINKLISRIHRFIVLIAFLSNSIAWSLFSASAECLLCPEPWRTDVLRFPRTDWQSFMQFIQELWNT